MSNLIGVLERTKLPLARATLPRRCLVVGVRWLWLWAAEAKIQQWAARPWLCGGVQGEGAHIGLRNGGALAKELLGAHLADLAGNPSRPGLTDAQLADMSDVAALVGEALAVSPAAFAFVRLFQHDADTVAHSVNVMRLGLALAQQAARDGLLEGDIDLLVDLGIGLALHDVGKLRVRAEILNKPGSLTPAESAEVLAHPMNGWELLQHADVPPRALAIVRSHHERWDGAGYPDRLTGDNIGLLVQIASVADVYDAIAADRPYRVGAGATRAKAALLRSAGVAFSTQMVALFARAFPPDLDLPPELPEEPPAQVIELRPLARRAMREKRSAVGRGAATTSSDRDRTDPGGAPAA